MSMESSAILDESIAEQRSSTDVQSVSTFVEGVEDRVQEKTEGMRSIFGDRMNSLIGEALGEAKSYKQSKLELFDTDFQVRDTESKGAAGWNDKRDNSIAVSENAMEREVNKQYWNGVADHELVHKLEQAATFNRSVIAYQDDVLDVHPVLVEWHAITASGQSLSDLTPEYREHKRRGDALVAFLGSAQPLLTALESGDMQSLQDRIDAQMITVQLQKQPSSFEKAEYVVSA